MIGHTCDRCEESAVELPQNAQGPVRGSDRVVNGEAVLGSDRLSRCIIAKALIEWFRADDRQPGSNALLHVLWIA